MQAFIPSPYLRADDMYSVSRFRIGCRRFSVYYKRGTVNTQVMGYKTVVES